VRPCLPSFSDSPDRFQLPPFSLPPFSPSLSTLSPVHIVGHYIRQEDFDQEPYSGSEYGSDYDEDDSEFDDEEMSGLIAGSDEDETMDEARIQEILDSKPKACAAFPPSHFYPFTPSSSFATTTPSSFASPRPFVRD
jgi:hypothetical protein